MSELGDEIKVKKTTVEECWSLDAAKLARQGLFVPHGYWGASLTWTNGFGEQTLSVPYWVENAPRGLTMHLQVRPSRDETVDEKILLQTTRPHFGGLRWWFVCPLNNHSVECGRRVRKLYRPRGVWYFGCRHCLDLTYRSVQEHDKRIDYLVKHFYLIPAMVKSNDARTSLLALRACGKIYGLY